VIQEVALSTRAEIVCGDENLSWDTLERVVNALNELGFTGMIATTADTGPVTSYGVPGVAKVVQLSTIRDRRKKGTPRPISWLMEKFVDSETTELRDKVYSVLGIATDAADNVFSPDYTKPSWTLFKDVTRFLITRDAKLDILRFAGGDKPGGSPMPSWCFSFHINKTRQTRLGTYPVTTFETPDFCFSDNGNHLRLRGFIIDEICQVGLVSSVIDRGALGEDETPNYYGWFCQARDMFQLTGQDDEVFWRTLLANKLTKTKDSPIDVPENAPDNSWAEDFTAFQTIFGSIPLEASDEEEKRILLSPEGAKAMRFRLEMIFSVLSRRFCLLGDKGSVGLMPREARAGDLVAAFLGASVLFAIRPLPVDERGNQPYQLVGECYVHDRMNGQVMKLGLEIKDIVLV